VKYHLPQFPIEELERTLAGVEDSESVLRFIEGSTNVGHRVSKVVGFLERVLPPVKIIFSGALSIYLLIKYARKFRKKPPTPLRIAGVTINVGIALTMFALSIALLFIPTALPVVTLVIVSLGLSREGFNLLKTGYKHWQSRLALIKDPEYHAALKHIGRRWKLANQLLDVVIGIFSVISVSLVITTGPIGWVLFASVAVVGLVAKLGLHVLKKAKLQPFIATPVLQHLSTREIEEQLEQHPHVEEKKTEIPIDRLSKEETLMFRQAPVLSSVVSLEKIIEDDVEDDDEEEEEEGPGR